MKALTDAEMTTLLAREPLWVLKDGKLTREWVFQDFLVAMAFVNQVAELAEEAGHHPDIDIRYNRVTLGLVTHDAGGVTERDAAMASTISESFPQPS
jgi:4a-hydroxytetrahydrobiopterin dehydratase